MKRQKVKVSVHSEMLGYGDWSMDRFIEHLEEQREKIPEQYRKSAIVVFERESDYEGGSDCYMYIHYERPEADDEFAYRKQEQQRRLQLEKQEELRLLERLIQRHPDFKMSSVYLAEAEARAKEIRAKNG